MIKRKRFSWYFTYAFSWMVGHVLWLIMAPLEPIMFIDGSRRTIAITAHRHADEFGTDDLYSSVDKRA